MSAKSLFCLFFVLYMRIDKVCLSDESPEVKTPLGRIRGSWEKTINGRTYAAFNGIPFAKPPVGELRFEEPQPIDPWPGVWDATTSYTCLQYAMFPDPKGVIMGNEDCLHLNVFVPTNKIDPKRRLEVLVFIHGGAFMLGSGHQMANASILMDKDFIFVTINYRVGVLGFLSTEDEVIPGNNGLKDQVLALRWIKENIVNFGGNPDAVTISGVSAGAASVHLHYFSPLSKGLFVRGLSHSGAAINPWVIKENPLDDARKLAALVGCSDGSTQELKQCLNSRPADLLAEKVKYFYGFGTMPFSPFAPVIEKNSQNAFLAKDPYLLLNEGNVLDVPWIISTAANEGLYPTALFYTELEKIDDNWPEIAHYLLDYNHTLPASERKTVAKKLKDFYLGVDEHITKENFKKFTQIFTDRIFTVGAENAAKLQSKANKSPVYYYYYNYGKGKNSLVRFFSRDPDVNGVSHGDDAFLFYGMVLLAGFSEEDIKLKNACQNMLYSYVTTGKPSFDGTDKWQPTEASELTYLNVTDAENIKLQTTESLTPVEFWKTLGLLEYENVIRKDEL